MWILIIFILLIVGLKFLSDYFFKKQKRASKYLLEIKESDPKNIFCKVINKKSFRSMIEMQTNPTINGLIFKLEDIVDIENTDDLMDSICFDKRESYYYIDFTTNDIDKITIPFNTEFGGTEKSGGEFFGTGFRPSTNGTIIPEWKANDLSMSNGIIRKMDNGKNTLLAALEIDEKTNTQKWVKM